MSYKPKQTIEFFAPMSIRIVNVIIALSYLFVMSIQVIVNYNSGEIILLLAWVFLPLIFLIPYFILAEWYLRRSFVKEIKIEENLLILVYRSRIVKIPFNSIKKRSIDDNNIIHYFTDIDFRYNINFQKGQITLNVLPDEVVEKIENYIQNNDIGK